MTFFTLYLLTDLSVYFFAITHRYVCSYEVLSLSTGWGEGVVL